MASLLSIQRLSHSNLNKYSHYVRRFGFIQQNRRMFQWAKTNIIDPIIGMTEHASNYPLNISVGVASICVLSYGLREYGSRKITYVPNHEFIPAWKALLKNVQYQEIEFKNIINNDIDLHGLYIKGNNKNYSKYPILFLHGNAGNISHRIDNLLLLHDTIGCDIFIFDYRGYGKSSHKFKPTQNGLIEDTISAMNELKKITNNQDIKPIIFGRSLGGAVAIHSMQPLVQQYATDIGGVIIENSFTSCWDCVGNNFLYPFIVDKWNNIECMERLKRENITNIPMLFISAINDTLLDPIMMKHLRDYAKYDAGFTKIKSKEFEDADHNDTYLSDGYTETLNSFIQFVDSQ